ncbi:ribonuclease, partial [Clostridium saudiense]|nr:ribonuclease [Clostridium saudiense]
GYILKLSYLENLIKNEILRAYRENSINDFYIELDESYKENVKEDLVGFLTRIDGLDKEIYLNFIDNLEGYKLEPLIFASQKENYQSYKIKTI